MAPKPFLSSPQFTPFLGSVPLSLFCKSTHILLCKTASTRPLGFQSPKKYSFGLVWGGGFLGGAGAGGHCLLQLPYERWWLNPLVLIGSSSNQSNNVQCMAEKGALTIDMFNTEIMLFRTLWAIPQVNFPLEINRIDSAYAGYFSCGCIMVANWQVKICTWTLVENTLKVYI